MNPQPASQTATTAVGTINPLRELQRIGQSVWLDYIRRSLITSGELKHLVEEDGLGGVTSNPTIFDKAIAGSNDYDEALQRMLAQDPRARVQQLFETLAVEDIQMAADVLRPVYERTGGVDGYVSLEVSPTLARDTQGTIEEARRLWKAVNRPNLLIKVPGTPEGIPAIESLLAEGINVNVTLMFSLQHYEQVAQAYIRGASRCPQPQRIASVASFFVSRVDNLIDPALEAVGTPDALALRGKAGIANCKRVYQRFRELFYGEPFAALRKRGAHVQRVLWASTSTKNPAYSDVLYAEELIGKDTVNTLPPATLKAFRDHGRVRGATIEETLEAAELTLRQLEKVGVSLDQVTEKLQVDGVASFTASYEQLLKTLEEKRRTLLAGQLDRQTLSLGDYQKLVDDRLQGWQAANFGRRLWAKDYTLWSSWPMKEITDRMGWLHLPETMHEQLNDLLEFREQAKAEGFTHAVLLGMGGSSLAPEVYQTTFGNAPGYPKLIVLDSTHPAAVRAVEAAIDLPRTIFLVSSKSGTTTEMLSFFYHFWQQLSRVSKTPGKHFVAITDPGTPLERLGKDRGFRRVFSATPDVGGRYSALTHFGLVPAALIGLDLRRLLDRAWAMSESCAFCVPVAENPGAVLGAALGETTVAGRDKVTFIASESVAALPIWLEQLIAESTGKSGKGIVPVADEPIASPAVYGTDRVFVHIRMAGEDYPELRDRIAALEAARHPVVRIRLQEKVDLGQEFFRWEMAIAGAGAVLGIHPFNQPDVQLAKDLARQAMQQSKAGGAGGASAVPPPVSAAHEEELRRAVKGWLAQAKPGDYIGLHAYLAPTRETANALQEIRLALRDGRKLATTLGYGPRFLHSTGQLHKGGANTGMFLQLIDDATPDLAVPETDYSFGALIQAQALGDYTALLQRGRRVIRVHLGGDVAGGLKRLAGAVRG